MGVQGLWQLVNSAGRPVTLESLENKILAVDVSIWLHQAVQGCRVNSCGGNANNAHLLTIFNRLCKLLFYRIKPVFVFDGGIPLLKKQTVAARRQRKEIAAKESSHISQKLLKTILHRQLVQKKLKKGNKRGNVNQELPNDVGLSNDGVQRSDIFQLSDLPAGTQAEFDKMYRSSDSDKDDDDDCMDLDTFQNRLSNHFQSIDAVDVNSEAFTSLPLDIQHEILTELKENRKSNSWAKMDEMPKESDNFSSYQMSRLLKRRNLQQKLEEVEKGIGAAGTDIDIFGNDVKIDYNATSRRIVSEDYAHYILANLNPKAKDKVEFKVEENKSKHDMRSKNSAKTSYKAMISAGDGSNKQNVYEVLEDYNSEDSEDVLEEIQSVIFQGINEARLKNDLPIYEKAKPALLATFRPDSLDLPSTSSTNFVGDGEQLHNELEKSVKAFFSSVALDAQGCTMKLSEMSKQKSSAVENKFPVIQLDYKSKPFLEVDLTNDTSAMSDFIMKEEKLMTGVKTHVAVNPEKVVSPPPLRNNVQKSNFDGLKKGSTQISSRENDLKDISIVKNLENSVSNSPVLVSSTVIKATTPVAVISIATDESSDDLDFVEVKSTMSIDKAEEQDQLKSVFEQLIQPEEKEFTEIIGNESQKSIETEANIKTTEQAENIELSIQKQFSLEELKKLESDLKDEELILRQEKAKQDATAKTVTDQMYSECQELLRLFGVPYVVSPMEAEAQCAILDTLNLTHGTITDDSDIWLFGGKRVYKNFFNQKKHVEFFKNSDLTDHFGLNRLKMICLALMTGSDYTDGIEGVGCVTAMEILSEFANEGLECLRSFKKWWDNKKKSGSVAEESPVRKKLQRLRVPSGFPNESVAKAYLEPAVDDSPEKFTWGTPDLACLREYAQFKFGWSCTKVDSILLPVLKKQNVHETQTRIDSFFKVNLAKDLTRTTSKRVQKAIQKASQKNNQVPEETAKEKAVKIMREKQKEQLIKTKRAAVKRKTAIKEAKLKKTRSNVRTSIRNEIELSEDSSD